MTTERTANFDRPGGDDSALSSGTRARPGRMRAHAEIFAAVLAGGAAGWYLRELWLRDAARREAEVRSGGARSKILRPRFVLTVRVLPPPHPHPPVTSNRLPRSQAMVQRGIDAATPEALLAEAQIPARAGREFPVSSGDTALVLIDMQFDFLSKEGRLGGEYSDARGTARGDGGEGGRAPCRRGRRGADGRAQPLAPVRRAGPARPRASGRRRGLRPVPSCRPLPGIVADKRTFGAAARTSRARASAGSGASCSRASSRTCVSWPPPCRRWTGSSDVPRRGLLRRPTAVARARPRAHQRPQTLKENHHNSVGLYFGEVAKLDDVEKALAKCGKAR